MTNFAETFRAIFREIFGEWPPKPRIKKVVGGWVCRAESSGTQAFGDTPDEAYRLWQSHPMVYRPTFANEASK